MATLNLQVAASADDTFQYKYYGGGTYFSIVYGENTIGNYSADYYKAGFGARFLNVTIPKGATITAASLIITSRYAASGATCNARVSAEDVDDAAAFSTEADFNTRFNTHTTARIDWDAIAAWSVDEEGADTTSPDIKTVIQEIVDRAGWVSGNDIVIFCEDFDARSSNGALRNGYSYDLSTSKAPKLHVEYTEAAMPHRSFYQNILAH